MKRDRVIIVVRVDLKCPHVVKKNYVAPWCSPDDVFQIVWSRKSKFGSHCLSW